MKTLLSLALAGVVATAFSSAQAASDSVASRHAAEPASTVVLTSAVEWGPLNPARGDKGPKAGNLWGDRTGSEASGFLVKFADGFSSPPHIHNVTYREVVISGLVHNDDPDAGEMWMPAGSFWIQPAGEVHITAAKGRNNLAYIEIEKGPYLVLPSEKAFDRGERPVNVDASNFVWLDASETTWIDQPGASDSADSPEIAFLWGNPQGDQLSGTIVKLPAGFSGEINSHGTSFRAVVIQGRPIYGPPDENDAKNLEAGSYFSSIGEKAHPISNDAGGDCLTYVRSEGKFEVIPTQPGK